MVRLRYLLPLAVFTLLVLGVSLRTSHAQFDVETCPTIIEDALSAVGDNCGGLNRNSACYGFNVVQATFTEALATDFFSRPSDRSPISSLATIGTTPLRADLNQWGIALMSVQANLPDTLPGQNVVFMLLGDTEVENAVAPENAYIPGGTANVTTNMGVDLRYEADLNADVMGSIPGGTTVVADAISSDGQWLRVTYNDNFGWVLTAAVTTTDDLSALGVYGENTRTPMQAFYFRNNITSTDCTQAPDALLVQGPQNLTIDITIAGADVRMGSSALFRIIPVDAALLQILRGLYGDDIEVGSLLQVIAIDGEIYLNPDTPDEELLRPGYTTTRCLSLPDDLGLDNEANDGAVFDACPWGEIRPLTPEEVEQFRALDGFGDSALNYELDIPNLPDELPTPTNTFTRAPQVVVLPPATRTPTATFTPTNTTDPGQPPPPPQPTNTFTNTWTITPSGTYFSPTPTDTFTPTSTFTDTPTDEPTSTFTPTPTDTPQGCALTNPTFIPNGDVAALRSAIVEANKPDCAGVVIELAGEGSYTFDDAASLSGAVIGMNALPLITGDVRINGNIARLYRGETGELRFFEIAVGGTLRLNSVTLQYGHVPSANGGAIYNQGSLFLSGVSIQNNNAGMGAGIYNIGSLNASYSWFGYNNADNLGGGLSNAGTTTLDHVIFEGNYALSSGGGFLNNGSMTVTNTSLVENCAGFSCVPRLTQKRMPRAGAVVQGGGAVNNGTLTMLNSTFYGNRSDSIGGNLLNGSTVTLSFVTIAGGSASSSGSEFFNAGTANVESSLVVGYGAGGACSGSFNVTNSYSDDDSCAGFQFVSDAGLEGYYSYPGDGSVPVVKLVPGSAVIDVLPDCTDFFGNTITTDAVGGGRPEDGNQNGTFECDPGAYEHDPFDFYDGGE
jgi:hypothetical protein